MANEADGGGDGLARRPGLTPETELRAWRPPKAALELGAGAAEITLEPTEAACGISARVDHDTLKPADLELLSPALVPGAEARGAGPPDPEGLRKGFGEGDLAPVASAFVCGVSCNWLVLRSGGSGSADSPGYWIFAGYPFAIRLGFASISGTALPTTLGARAGDVGSDDG